MTGPFWQSPGRRPRAGRGILLFVSMKFISLRKACSRVVLLLSAAALALPMVSAGCSETKACFEWSQFKGACPARDKALSFFTSPACAGNILAVNGEPSFENDLCCYAV